MGAWGACPFQQGVVVGVLATHDQRVVVSFSVVCGSMVWVLGSMHSGGVMTLWCVALLLQQLGALGVGVWLVGVGVKGYGVEGLLVVSSMMSRR